MVAIAVRWQCYLLQLQTVDDLKRMSSTKRTHTTEVGSITCPELSDFGAGTESWLVQTPNLLTSLHTHTLALSNRHLILLINFHETHSFKIRPQFPDSQEHISALSFLSFHDVTSIVIGTSRGYIMMFSLSGELIHRQLVYPSKVLKLRVREGGSEMVSCGDLLVSLEGIIARFDGAVLRELFESWVEERSSGFWDESKEGDLGNKRLVYQLWDVNKFRNSVDAVITGLMPPPLMEIQSNQRYYCAVTIGEDAVISAYRLSEDRSRSLVGAILSKVVPATFSTIASFSKMIWRSDQNSNKKTEAKPQSFAKASPLTCLKDHPRKGEKLILSPSGTLAAITDSLGRILLLDTQALVVVRLWKGYRDASCLFMEMQANKDSAQASSSYYEPSKSDYFLCLAIHAPRKGIIEIWQMRTGPRLLTIQCAKGSIMLQPTFRFESLSDSPYVPLEVFLLNGDSGQLSVLNRSIN